MAWNRTILLMIISTAVVLVGVSFGDDEQTAMEPTTMPAGPAVDPDEPPPPPPPIPPPPPHEGSMPIRPPAPPDQPPLTAEQEAEAMEFLKANQPDHYKRVLELRTTHPMRYHQTLRIVYERKNLPESVRSSYLQDQQARIHISRLLGHIRRTKEDSPEKAKLIASLREAVIEQFDAEQNIRQYRLELLERQITELREKLKQRNEQREQNIDMQVERLLKTTTQPAEPEKNFPDHRSQHHDRPESPEHDRPS